MENSIKNEYVGNIPDFLKNGKQRKTIPSLLVRLFLSDIWVQKRLALQKVSTRKRIYFNRQLNTTIQNIIPSSGRIEMKREKNPIQELKKIRHSILYFFLLRGNIHQPNTQMLARIVSKDVEPYLGALATNLESKGIELTYDSPLKGEYVFVKASHK